MELPDIYIKIAKATKQEVRKLIQNTMVERCTAPTAYSGQSLIVTPSIAAMISEFEFVAGDSETLSQGLHPFIINNGDAAQRTASLQNATKFDLMEANGFAIALSDLESLLAKEAKHVPITFTELELTLAIFGDLLVILLNVTHTVVKAYKKFWEEWKRSHIRLSQMIDITRTLEPAHIMRRIQLSLFLWFDTVRRGDTPRAIDFVSILDDLNLSTFIKPQMPANFYKTESHMLPEVGGPAEPPISKTSTKQRAAVVINPAGPDAKLFELFEGLRMREVIKNESMPTNKNGTTMCLSYHGKGQCYTDCKRVGDHKVHTTAEQKALITASERAVQAYWIAKDKGSKVKGSSAAVTDGSTSVVPP
jgi:hypothetical protein